MRKIILLLSLAFCNILSFGQDNDWKIYDADANVSIEMPGEVFLIDTIINGIQLYQLYSQRDKTTFTLSKTVYGQEKKDQDLSALPGDMESLEEFYEMITSELMGKIPYDLESRTISDRDGYVGYHVKFKDSLNSTLFETEFLLLGQFLYSATYSSPDNFQKKDNDQYFNGFKVKSKQKINQLSGKSRSYRAGVVLGKYIFYLVIIVVLITFIVLKNKRRKRIRTGM